MDRWGAGVSPCRGDGVLCRKTTNHEKGRERPGARPGLRPRPTLQRNVKRITEETWQAINRILRRAGKPTGGDLVRRGSPRQ